MEINQTFYTNRSIPATNQAQDSNILREIVLKKSILAHLDIFPNYLNLCANHSILLFHNHPSFSF